MEIYTDGFNTERRSLESILGRYKGTLPWKGTKQREIALLLLRPDGLAAGEAISLGLVKNTDRFHNVLRNLEYDYDLIIGKIGDVVVENTTRHTGRRQNIYRIKSFYRYDRFREISYGKPRKIRRGKGLQSNYYE